MNAKTSNDQNKEVYHQSIPAFVLVVIASSMIVTFVLFSNYSKTESFTQLIFANIFLLIAIIFIKPIVEWRRIAVDSNYITVHKLFFKPIVINITQSLYQVVIYKDEIRSYRFRVGENYIQISPQAYRNGYNLSKRLKLHIARNNLFIDAVNS